MDTKLYEGRWEDVLPTLEDESIDLIYTDPPYGKEYKSNIPGDKRWNKKEESDSRFEEHLLNDSQGCIDWKLLAQNFYRLAKPGAYLFLHCDQHIIVNHARHFVDAGFVYKGQICWNKKFAIGGDLKGSMKRDWEPILYMCKGKGTLKPVKVTRGKELVERKRISEIDDWVFPLLKSDKSGFPTQKPMKLAQQIIELTTVPGDIVLDCFAGSGTAPLAATSLNRGYIAIEADDKWLPKLAERLQIQAIVEEKRKGFRGFINQWKQNTAATQAEIRERWKHDFDGTDDSFDARMREIPATEEWFSQLN